MGVDTGKGSASAPGFIIKPPTSWLRESRDVGGLCSPACSLGLRCLQHVCADQKDSRGRGEAARKCTPPPPARAHRTASSWSLSSGRPSRRRTSCRSFVPWKPLPRPSHLSTTAPWLLTSTVSQVTANFSSTLWLPGAPSLQKTAGTGFSPGGPRPLRHPPLRAPVWSPRWVGMASCPPLGDDERVCGGPRSAGTGWESPKGLGVGRRRPPPARWPCLCASAPARPERQDRLAALVEPLV